MKAYKLIDKDETIKLPIKTYKELRALAYRRGVHGSPAKWKYDFEAEAYAQGQKDEVLMRKMVFSDPS